MLAGAKQSGKPTTLSPIAYIAVNPCLLGERAARVILASRREGRESPKKDALYVATPPPSFTEYSRLDVLRGHMNEVTQPNRERLKLGD